MRAHPDLKPLHPPVTDFPIALWVMSFVFDLFSFRVGNAMVKAAFFNIAAGCIIAILAAALGIFDYLRVLPGVQAKRLGLVHAALNVLALLVFSVDLWA